MNKLVLALLALLPLQESQRQPTPRVIPSDRIGNFGRTRVNILHVRDGKQITCPVHAKGDVCPDIDHWSIQIRSNVFTLDNLSPALRSDAELSLDSPQPDGTQVSQREVMINGDRTAPYGVVQRVIESCYAAGFYKIAVGVGGSEVDGVFGIRIALFWNARTRSVVRHLGTATAGDDAELEHLLKEARETGTRNKQSDVPVTIDAGSDVPWAEVVRVVDICRRLDVDNVQFAVTPDK